MTQQTISSPNSAQSQISKGYFIKSTNSINEMLIPPRRGAFPVLTELWEEGKRVAHIDRDDSFKISDEMFTHFGLNDYVGCSTFERKHPIRRGWAKRPIPHFSPVSESSKLIALFEEWGPFIYSWIKEHMEPSVQTYDKHSRLGAPEFKISENKLQILIPYFETLSKGKISWLWNDNIFVINNIRLQAERKDKEREYYYLNENGIVYSERVGKTERYDDNIRRYCSRVRLVFNYPVSNLLTQIVDTSIHNLLLKYTPFHHNMSSRAGKPMGYDSIFLDVKHFDRDVGAVVSLRSKYLGGLYNKITQRMLELPYLVSDDSGHVKLMEIDQKGGYRAQLGSGISCVAPIAKEIFLILYSAYFQNRYGWSKSDCLRRVLEGGSSGCFFLNYGDDNVLFGEEAEIHKCHEFLKQFLTVEKEDPSKFLGYYYTDQTGFFLGKQSYLLNFYLAERSPKTRFRPYPFLGIKLRREVFGREGEPDIRTKIIPKEDELWNSYGYTLARILIAAEREEELALASNDLNEVKYLGKEYLMSEEEKAALPRYSILDKQLTSRYIERLLHE